MKHIYFLILSINFFIISCAKNDKHDNFKEPTTPLILISMDGFRWDYFEKTDTPNFDTLIKGGSRAKSLIPVFPTKTFPNHITIATGNYPINHGIIANRMYDSVFNEEYYIGEGSKPVLDGKWYEAEPIWVTVEKSGLKSMTMFWPASEARIMGYRPTEYFVYDGSVSHRDRINQVLRWLDYTKEKKPSFISLYFSHTDTYGHKYGPESNEIKDAIKEMDITMGLLLDGLIERKMMNSVNIMLVSDHGMATTSADSIIFLDDLIDLSDIQVVDWTPVGSIIPNIDKQVAYDKLIKANKNLNVFKKGYLPKKLNYNDHRRIQPIILIANEGWSIKTKDYFETDDHAGGYGGGTHGYDPEYKSMHGVFVGYGPAFKSGFQGDSFSSIHLYEMMCNILNIAPAKNDGSLDSTKTFLK